MDGHQLFTIGHHDSNRPLPVRLEDIESAHAADYDMITCPVTNSHFHSRILSYLSSTLSEHSGQDEIPIEIPPLDPLDTPLTPEEHVSQLIGVTSSWTDLASPDPFIASVSKQVLRLELAYAAFCGINNVVIPGPRHGPDSDIAHYARAILDGLNQGPYMNIYIWCDMTSPMDSGEEQVGSLATFARQEYLLNESSLLESPDVMDAWLAWDTVRSMAKYSTRLCVALSIPNHMPPLSVQSRWYSEPVRVLTLDAKTFSTNAKAYPALSRVHQDFIFRMLGLKTTPWFLLCNVGPVSSAISALSTSAYTSNGSFPTLAEAVSTPQIRDPTPHLTYLRHLQSKQPVQSALDRFGAGYQDYLQAPLQPLTVNLESITYEVFEKDPIKYEWYERAIARALHDWIEEEKPTSNPDGRVVVAVVGAGRGPLVTRALKAAEDVGVDIDMWALEKNPNAFVLIQRHNQNTWNHQVQLVKSDMRTWKGPKRDSIPSKKIYNIEEDEDEDSFSTRDGETSNAGPGLEVPKGQSSDEDWQHYKIDILISELLGSFADNELSPECLDGVQRLLNPSHGISIPSSYTAHITPIAAPKLHADISLGMSTMNVGAAEIPYVVMLNAIDFLSIMAPTKSASSNYRNTTDSSKSQSAPHSQNSATATDSARFAPQPMIKQTWSFQHPNPSLSNSLVPSTSSGIPSSNSHNGRHSSKLRFPIPHQGSCHGLAGYFETVLYPGVELSTNPENMEQKSPGMISWFPIYFPLKNPIFLPSQSEVEVSMWRQTDDRKVWYEWIVEVYAYSSIAEKGGKTTKRRVRIGGSELHSSEKEACLM